MSNQISWDDEYFEEDINLRNFHDWINFDVEQLFAEVDRALKPRVFYIGFFEAVRDENQRYVLLDKRFCKYGKMYLKEIADIASAEADNASKNAAQDYSSILRADIISNLNQKDEQWTTFCSYPRLANSPYRHCFVMQLDREVYEKHRAQGRSPLLDALAEVFLAECSRRILSPESNDDGSPISTSPLEFLRRAGRQLVADAERRAGTQTGPFMMFESIDMLSAMAYEGRRGVGRIIFGEPAHCIVRLKAPVSFIHQEHRRVLKLLQMCDEENAIFVQNGSVQGIVTVPKQGYVAVITGSHSWDLCLNTISLMLVRDGRPSLPRDKIPKETFIADLRTCFGSLRGIKTESLWGIVNSALCQSHGTTIVIAADARSEASRLGGQSMEIEPTALSASDVKRVSSIDGAILVDTKGVCHALGVILDGASRHGIGDPARGARYNSAVRYVHDGPIGQRFVLVISEDGMVNPLWRKRTKKAPG